MCVGGECSHLGLAGPVEEALGGKEGGERNKSKFLWEISLKVVAQVSCCIWKVAKFFSSGLWISLSQEQWKESN